MSAVPTSIERDTFVTWLEDAGNPAEVGNKAWNLGRMQRLGVCVPRGFVVTAGAFRQFVAENCLSQRLAGLSYEEIRTVIRTSSIPEEILDAIVAMRRSLPPGRLIVRSSAIGEDGGKASFAGQLDSIADVETTHDLGQALLACWSSYWNERILSYQSAIGVRLNGMAVIVQSQIDGAASGVLFTQTPRTHEADDRLYVEYCAGFGEALVSGRVTPGSFHISKTPPYRVETTQKLGLAVDNLVLSENTTATLATTAIALECHFGAPQDIEWTTDDSGAVFFVQSRPITTVSRPVLWSNSNINENFPDIVTPLLYSIAREGYYHYFRNLAVAFGLSKARTKAMESAFTHIIGVHHGRLFYNLTSIHDILREAPFGETLARFFNQFVGAEQVAANLRQEHRPRWRQWAEAARIAVQAPARYVSFARRIVEFERRADAFAAVTRPETLRDRPLLRLRDDMRSFMDIRCHGWTNASLADTAAMVCYGLLQLILHRAYPGGEKASLHNNLLKGLSTVISVQPAVDLWEISRKILRDPGLTEYLSHANSRDIAEALTSNSGWKWLSQDIHEYLDRWGYRFSGELMLTVPSFQENPSPLFDMLKTFLKAEGKSPNDSIQELQAERLAETRRALEDFRRNKRITYIPVILQASILKLLLRSTHRAIEMRERARLKQALLYSRCRRIALAIGDRLAESGVLQDANDIFFFTYRELDDFLSGYAMFPGDMRTVALSRRESHIKYRGELAPDTFTLPEGAYFHATDNTAAPGNPGESGEEMHGTGACGGNVTARATVLETVADAHQLLQGDILVTRQTDPGWAPVFPLIRGLVIERGGMLSHGAIIAREFGLPCVAGVKDAMVRIPQHCRLTVDGDRGCVRILDEEL